MTTITIPIWIFALSLGVPGLIFLGLVGLIIGKIRNPQKNEFVNMSLQCTADRQSSDQQFHNDLLGKQIDTIFNGLNAIIETERLKINALLNSNHNILQVSKAASVETSNKMNIEQVSRAPETHAPTNLPEIEKNTAAQEQEDAFVNEMSLSQTEIDLAMIMRSAGKNPSGRKLEAVA